MAGGRGRHIAASFTQIERLSTIFAQKWPFSKG
jgi:hypothetical protein